MCERVPHHATIGCGLPNGLAPNGLRAMDLIEPEFRPRYENICIGNKPANAQIVFFEGLLA
jgi:salicylate hydroxylase